MNGNGHRGIRGRDMWDPLVSYQIIILGPMQPLNGATRPNHQPWPPHIYPPDGFQLFLSVARVILFLELGFPKQGFVRPDLFMLHLVLLLYMIIFSFDRHGVGRIYQFSCLSYS